MKLTKNLIITFSFSFFIISVYLIIAASVNGK